MKQVAFKILFFCFITLEVAAQSAPGGSLKIVQDKRVDKLLTMYSQFKTAHPTIEGYKIQIFMDSGNDAVDKANVVVGNFTGNFPETAVELTYGAPYYRVRVGNFRNRIEAEGYLKKILPYFSQAFITKDKIRP